MAKTGTRLRLRPYIKDCITQVLQETRSPLRCSEITERVLKIRPIAGRTPQNTIYAILSRKMGVLYRSERGKYSLKAVGSSK